MRTNRKNPKIKDKKPGTSPKPKFLIKSFKLLLFLMMDPNQNKHSNDGA